MGLDQRPSGRGHLVNPFTLIARWADWYDSRGVYVPGEDSQPMSAPRDFGWVIIGWLLTVAAVVVLFAVAT